MFEIVSLRSSIVLLLPFLFLEQASDFPARAEFSVSDTKLVLTANFPRPLQQALQALCERFGWVVDYEDPRYAEREGRDDSDPGWRKAHPTERGAIDPSGGLFRAELGSETEVQSHESETLSLLVEQYNRTDNPGSFRLIQRAGHRFAIVGRSRLESRSLGYDPLERLLSFEDDKPQNGGEALQDMLDRCSSGSGSSLVIGTVPFNLLAHARVPTARGTFSCRDRLEQIVGALPRPSAYWMLYDMGWQAYALNIIPSAKAQMR